MREHAASAVENVIYSFAGGSGSMADGENPRAGLVIVDDTLYGTTFVGGDCRHKYNCHGSGTVFSVTPYGTETVLHRFSLDRNGRYPYAGLTVVDGTLYGTTEEGGKGNAGTVFKIAASGAITVLHRFVPGGADAAGPRADMIDVNGTLYGTTGAGGGIGCDDYGCGTVFSITPSGKEKVIHSFGGSGDGKAPFAGLLNVDGTLYGTTSDGNASGFYGTVFAVTPSGKETVIHAFKEGAGDGEDPWAGLINVSGTLYGTTVNGGASCRSSNNGCGTVFSITPSGKEKVLYSFKGGTSDGVEPEAGLLNVDGTLYGTTAGGGTNSRGTVFSITLSGVETVLHSFGASGDGANPEAGLINVNGTLYGTTVKGGTDNDGTVFSLTP
ncbi:MAG TPA: choice-of-anchor tandem repeat GloVer-containing protein [Candidatus Cybelea sp.]|nr:choice-of-anchor tandem repeat GloVer-containing protein [Candidatus Cybelea sp.]